MAKFSALFQRTASATLSVGAMWTVTANLKRLKVYDMIIGSEAAPNDFAFLWHITRSTTAATGGTTPVANALDPGDSQAASTVLHQSATADGTLGTVLVVIPLNQRATFRWVAPQGAEVVGPATNLAGFHIRTPTAGALVAVTANLPVFEEL